MADKESRFNETTGISDTGSLSREQRPGWAMRTSGPGEIKASADAEGEHVRARVTSSDGPPQNEAHAVACARMVVGRLRQLRFPWENALAHGDGPRYWPVEAEHIKPEWIPKREEFERLFDPGKADAAAWGRQAPLVAMQVTRIMVDECFWKWAKNGAYDGSLSVAVLALAIWNAIEEKTEGYSDDPSRTMLVLDPSAVIAVAHPRVLPVFFEKWGDHEYLDRWACVWLGSLVPQDCKRLDGRGVETAPILGINPCES